MHSIRSIAARIAEIDNLSDEAAALVHSQLRNLAAKGYLTPLPGKAGRTSAGSYSDLEAARARALAELVASGYTVRDFNEVNDALDRIVTFAGHERPQSSQIRGAYLTHPGLEQAVRGLKFDEDWRLRIERWHRSDGTFYTKARVVWANDVDPSEDDEVRKIVGAYYGDRCRKVDEIRLSGLLRGFVGA